MSVWTIPFDENVAIAVCCLATKVEYRTASHLFGVWQASVHLIFWAIQQQLLTTYIIFPSRWRFEVGYWRIQNKVGLFTLCRSYVDATRDNHSTTRQPCWFLQSQRMVQYCDAGNCWWLLPHAWYWYWVARKCSRWQSPKEFRGVQISSSGNSISIQLDGCYWMYTLTNTDTGGRFWCDKKWCTSECDSML